MALNNNYFKQFIYIFIIFIESDSHQFCAFTLKYLEEIFLLQNDDDTIPQENKEQETLPTSSKVSQKRNAAREEEDILTCVLNVMKSQHPVPLLNHDDDDLFGQVIATHTTHMKKIAGGLSKEKLKLKIQQLLVDAEFGEDPLVPVHTNRMTWPGQFANAASMCVSPQTRMPSSSEDSNAYTTIVSPNTGLTY